MDQTLETLDALFGVPLISLSALIGETHRTDEHLATLEPEGVLEEMAVAFNRAEVGGLLTMCTAVWGTRRLETGDITIEASMDPYACIADARQYATDHPDELAKHDQQFAAFMKGRKGEG